MQGINEVMNERGLAERKEGWKETKATNEGRKGAMM